MKLERTAYAGAEVPGDLLVQAEPGQGPLRVELRSTVADLFGPQITATARAVADELGIDEGVIRLQDRGALDYVVRARVETALHRAEA